MTSPFPAGNGDKTSRAGPGGLTFAPGATAAIASPTIGPPSRASRAIA